MRRGSLVPWKSFRHHTAFVFAQTSDQEHSKKGVSSFDLILGALNDRGSPSDQDDNPFMFLLIVVRPFG